MNNQELIEKCYESEKLAIFIAQLNQSGGTA